MLFNLVRWNEGCPASDWRCKFCSRNPPAWSPPCAPPCRPPCHPPAWSSRSRRSWRRVGGRPPSLSPPTQPLKNGPRNGLGGLGGEGRAGDLEDGRGDDRRGDGGEEGGAVEDREEKERREGGVMGRGAGVEVGMGSEVGSLRSWSLRHWNHWGSALTMGSQEAPA